MVVPADQLIRELSIGLSICLIAVMFIMSYIFYKKYQEKKESKLILAASLLFLFLAIGRVFFVYFDFILTEFNPALYQSYLIYWKIATSFQVVGFFVLVVISEREIFKGKTRYIFSIILGVFTIIAMCFPTYLYAQFWSTIPLLIATLFLPVAYLYLAYISPNHIRKKSIAIFFALIVFAMGYVGINEPGVSILISLIYGPDLIVRYVLHIMSVAIKFGAILLASYGFLTD